MSRAARDFCVGFSTFLARRIAPAQVPKVGVVSTKDWRASRKPSRSRNLRKVVDSPPGMMRPSMLASSAGVRTSFAVTPRAVSALAWASNAPCRARTPMVRDSSRVVPPSPSILCKVFIMEILGLDLLFRIDTFDCGKGQSVFPLPPWSDYRVCQETGVLFECECEGGGLRVSQ